MSNNSMVCVGPDGRYGEIGRAQWVQAMAAGVAPEPAMNPVLLKPGSDRRSHVVVLGQPAGHVDAGNWQDGRRHLADAAHQAFDDLATRFEVVVAEGAGSPTEINLRSSDYVNMGLARHADLPTVVVGDIDRGGVFAALYGTVALLEPADQQLVAGFVVNKFRGELGLLAAGLRSIERLTGRPVYGVLPWHPALWLDSEDSLDLDARRAPSSGAAKVAVVRFPRISNLTDVDALGLEPGLDVTFVADPRDLSDANLVVLPGTRATLADLAWMRDRGLDAAVLAHAARGRPVLGICGGFQMLGHEVRDPEGVERQPSPDAGADDGAATGHVVTGLGLLDVSTQFTAEKVLRLPSGHGLGVEASGYEIHHGRVGLGAGDAFPGGLRMGNVFGTMWHGSLEGDAFRRAFLAEALGLAPTAGHAPAVSFARAREQRIDLLGRLVEEHLDVDALASLATNGAPAGLRVLPPATGS